MYLVRKNEKSRKVAHIWLGEDTACRQYSTGGMTQKRYITVFEIGNLPICAMCASVANRDTLNKIEDNALLHLKSIL